jgi:hypothetical protein
MPIHKSDVKDYIYRHFLGKITVHCFPLDVPPPSVAKLRTSVEVMAGHSKARVIAPIHLAPDKLSCSNGGFRVGKLIFAVYGARIAKYASGEIQARRLKTKISLEVREGKKRLSQLPQERQNRLNFLPAEKRGIWENEIILAYFSPIVAADVVKIALNKQRGSLVLWYNAKGRHFDAKGLFMCKRLGARESQWHWL